MSRVFTAASGHYCVNASGAVRTSAPITIAAWIKPSSTGGTQCIALQSIVDGNSDYFALIRHVDGTCYCHAKDNGGNSAFALSTATTSIGVWSLVVGVFASSTSRSIYINGANKVTNTTSVTPSGINGTLVGSRYSGASAYELGMDGDIAEVAVWNIALSDAEVASLYVSAGVGIYPSQVQSGALVGYWKLLGTTSPEPATVSSLPLTVFGATGGTHLTMQNLGGGGGDVTVALTSASATGNVSYPNWAGLPEAPRIYYDTTYVTPTPANTYSPSDAAGLQSALNACALGDVILLNPSLTYTGHFNLPGSKSGSGYVVIRSSSTLTTEGVRITTAQAAGFPKIVTNDTAATIQAALSSSYFRFINVEFASGSTAVNGALVQLGPDGSVTIDPTTFPHHIILDRCYLHGHASNGGRRGVMFSGSYQAVIDSYISDFKEIGADTQAIAAWTGYGPYKIKNNYLEASGENVLFGGSGNGNVVDLTPSDIEIRNNHFFKPLTWKVGHPSYLGVQWSIKNILELKHAKRIMVEDNLFENCWAESQTGYGIVFTVRNQTGSTPWAALEDITFRNNELTNSDNAIQLLGFDDAMPSYGARRLYIYDNLIHNIGSNPSVDGILVVVTRGYDDITMDHNTCLHAGTTIVAGGSRPNERFQYTNNICQHNLYGILGDGSSTGNATLTQYFPGSTVTKNVFEISSGTPGDYTSLYPAGNSFVLHLENAGVNDIGFVNYPTDLRLKPTSPYHNQGTDGTDIGAILGAVTTFKAAWAASSNQLIQ